MKRKKRLGWNKLRRRIIRYIKIYGRLLSTGITIIVLGAGNTNAANEHESLEDIHAAVKQFIRSSYDASDKVEIEIALNDSRLRLARCDTPLNVFWRDDSRKVGRTSVGIRCNGNRHWLIYAPVRIKLYKPVVTAKAPLARQHILRADDIVLEEKDVSVLLGGYLSQADQYLGRVVKRPIVAGQVLLPHMFANPLLIKRGERVTLLVENSSLQVRMQGTALQDGSAGDIIHIRNAASKRVVEGRVISTSVVKIHM